MRWRLSHRFDRRALPLADRHYSRQKPGTPQFVKPGRCLVLILPSRDGLWVSSYPLAEYTKHEWAGAWECSLARNESGELGAGLIREAVAATRWHWGDAPYLGMVTFINPHEVAGYYRRHTLEWGYSFYKAGFRHVGWTKGGLYAMQLRPRFMPPAAAPADAPLSLFGAA